MPSTKKQWKWDPALTSFTPGANFKDRTGNVYASLTCLYPTRSIAKHTFWECACSCGNRVEVTSNNLQGRITTSCGCRRVGKTNPRWSGYEDISGSFLKNLQSNAAKRGLLFEVTWSYIWDLFIRQDRQCALSGVPLAFKGKTADETTASLDRVDSTKGYIEGNLQWVHKDINRLKMGYPQDYFLDLCTKVAVHSGGVTC